MHMSNVKRVISAFMAVLMVLGMFSCLSTVGFAGSINDYEHHADNWNIDYGTTLSDYTTNQNNQVKTYAQLIAAHGNDSIPFAYLAIEVFEPAADGVTTDVFANNTYWVPTDHRVSAGERLLVRYYIKSNAWLKSCNLWHFFSRQFFDIDPDNASLSYTAGNDWADGTNYAADGYKNTGYTGPISGTLNPDGPFGTGAGSIAPDGYVSVTETFVKGRCANNSYFRPGAALTGMGFSTSQTYSWDYTCCQYAYNYDSAVTPAAEQYPSQWITDTYYTQTIIKVRTHQEVINAGTDNEDTVDAFANNYKVGYIGLDENHAKQKKPQANHNIIVCASSTTPIGKGTNYKDATLNILSEDCNHVFVLDDGTTPATGHTVKFYDGNDELTNLALTNQTSNAVDISGVNYSKPGLTFGGWAATQGGTTPITSVDASASDVSVYAIWNAVGTFTSDGATFDTQTVAAGGNFTAPSPAPTKEGYQFIGWYDSSDATETILTFPVTANANTGFTAKFAQLYTINFVDRNETLTNFAQTGIVGDTINFPTQAQLAANPGNQLAGWTPNHTTIQADTAVYTAVWEPITYAVHYDSAGGSAVADGSFAYGAAITDPTAPSYPGYTFGSWSYFTDAAHNTPYTGSTMPASELYALASWTANTYTVSFTKDGDAYTTVQATFGQAINMPALPTEEGYTYSAWTPQDGYILDTVGGKTYNSTKTANMYQATFVSGGQTLSVDPYQFGAAVTFPNPGTPPTGMQFTGWNRQLNGVNTFIPDGTPETMPAGNATYEAVFEGTPHTVTYVQDGVTTTASVNYGAVIPLPDTAPPTGKHWSDWENLPADGTMPNNDITISRTSINNVYTITIVDAAGNTLDTIEAAYGAAVSEPDYTNKKEGYTFNGWSCGTFPATMPLDGATITALFTINSYRITYVLNNGEQNIVQTYDYQEAVTAPTVTKTGYTFAGWDPAVPQNMPAGNYETTAQWTINSYKLTYMVRDTTSGTYVRYNNSDIYLNYNEGITLLDKKSQTGWDYTDWSTDSTTSSAATVVAPPANMPANDLILYSTGTKHLYHDVWKDLDGTIIEQQDVEYQAAIPTVALPTHDGCDNPYWSPRLDQQPARDVEFTYSFTAGTVQYKIVYRVQQFAENDYVDEEPIIMTDKKLNDTVTASPAQKQRAGFTVNNALSTLTITVTSDGEATMIIALDRNQYTLTVKDASGTHPTDYYYDANLTLPTAYVPDGQTFKSWKFTKDANNTTIDTFPAKMPNYNFTATASYNTESYALKPYVDYKDGNGFVALTPVDYSYGETIAEVTAPVKEGWTFTGWRTDSSLANAYTFGGTMGTDDVEIYGSFTVNQYTIVFINDATNEEITTITADYGANVTYPTAPTVEGSNFTGWSATYETMPLGGATVRAYYNTGTFTLTYDIDGNLITRNYPYQAAITPIADPTKTGYTFAGWEPAVPQNMPGENYTVTATWRVNNYDATFIDVAGAETAYDTVNVTFGQEFSPSKGDPSRGQAYIFKGWKLQGTSDTDLVTFPYRMNAEGLTFIGVWEQNTAFTNVQRVDRVTDPYYQLGGADYAVTINQQAFKVHITDGTTTWTFGKGTFLNAPEASGISSIEYDENTGTEVWVINLAIPAAENGYKAYITTMDFYTEDPETQGRVFSVTYDERDAGVIATECAITGVTSNSQYFSDGNKLVRGESVTWTITTSDNVTWLKFNYGYTSTKDKDANDAPVVKNFNVLYKVNAEQSANFTVTHDDEKNQNVWVITNVITFSTSDTRVTQDWKLYYKTGATSAYIPVNEDTPVQFVVCRDQKATIDTNENYEKYSIIDATPSSAQVQKDTRSTVTIRTTDDCDKVRITINGKSATFQTTSKNTRYSDANGIRTWEIDFKYAQAAGPWTVSCNARGSAWGDAVTYNVVITA